MREIFKLIGITKSFSVSLSWENEEKLLSSWAKAA